MAGDTHLGEAGLLARMLPHLADGEQIEVGPGDDAAVVRLPSERLVVTTDTLVDGYDFLPRTTAGRWIGHKAAVQNLADVAAMGARPVRSEERRVGEALTCAWVPCVCEAITDEST